MYFIYDTTGTILSINNVPRSGDLVGQCEPAVFRHGFAPSYYYVQDGQIYAKTDAEVQALQQAAAHDVNVRAAKEEALVIFRALTGIIKENAIHVDMGLETLPDVIKGNILRYAQELQQYIKMLKTLGADQEIPELPKIEPPEAFEQVEAIIAQYNEGAFVS